MSTVGVSASLFRTISPQSLRKRCPHPEWAASQGLRIPKPRVSPLSKHLAVGFGVLLPLTLSAQVPSPVASAETRPTERATAPLEDRKLIVEHTHDPGWGRVPQETKAAPPINDPQRTALRQQPHVRAAIERAAATVHLDISATVVDQRATLLQWWHKGREYSAWSNLDWSLLVGITRWEAKGKQFDGLLLTGNADSRKLPKDSPLTIPPDLSDGPPRLQFAPGDDPPPEATEGILALMELHQRDRIQLLEARDAREKTTANEAARQAMPKPDAVLRVWKVQRPKLQPAIPALKERKPQ